VKSFTLVSTPTLSRDELNLRFNFKEYALPFRPVTSLGLNLICSCIFEPGPGESVISSNIKIPYKFVDLLAGTEELYKS